MNATTYESYGDVFLELISGQYNELAVKKTYYEKKGKKAWLNIYNACEGTWMLTVQLKEAA